MTFSDKTKAEIIENCEVLDQSAFLWGMIRGNVSLTLDKGRFGCVLSTDMIEVATYAFSALSHFGAELVPEQKTGLNKQKIYNVVLHGENAKKVLKDAGIMRFPGGVSEYDGERVPVELLDTVEKARGYVAGVFLTAGEVFLPKGSEGEGGGIYQLEFLFTSGGYASSFAKFLAQCGFSVKTTERRDSAVLYIKESDTISDLLAYMGAVDAVLEMQSVKVYRAVREKANRISNCEFANTIKSVDTAQRQIQAIISLKDSGRYDYLDEKLKVVAEARVAKDTLSLEALAEELGISKSCLNHRLRKIESIAKGEE
ncbi:MAG: DNA-binding protein WhiA [Clostridia bacterium]|nr:DNA-binding protein WhiA [Clostridia bacterium]